MHPKALQNFVVIRDLELVTGRAQEQRTMNTKRTRCGSSGVIRRAVHTKRHGLTPPKPHGVVPSRGHLHMYRFRQASLSYRRLAQDGQHSGNQRLWWDFTWNTFSVFAYLNREKNPAPCYHLGPKNKASTAAPSSESRSQRLCRRYKSKCPHPPEVEKHVLAVLRHFALDDGVVARTHNNEWHKDLRHRNGWCCKDGRGALS